MTQKEHIAPAPEGHLENALIEEFLQSRDLDWPSLRALSDGEMKQVLTDASAYASARLAEVESRAHFVHAIYGNRDLQAALEVDDHVSDHGLDGHR
jgi:hypothetical protein